MKNPIPVRWAIGLLLAMPLLAGCGSKGPTNPLPPGFVPAGYSRQNMPGAVGGPNASFLAQGDPSIPASVKAHVIIRGLPSAASQPHP